MPSNTKYISSSFELSFVFEGLTIENVHEKKSSSELCCETNWYLTLDKGEEAEYLYVILNREYDGHNLETRFSKSQ